MTSPLRLCVRRTAVPDSREAATLVTLRLPSDVNCIEEAVELVTATAWPDTRPPRASAFGSVSCYPRHSAMPSCGATAKTATSGWTFGPRLGPEAISVYVTDEGPGFDPSTIPEPLRPEQLDEASGRGLFLIRKLVDAVQFNAQGNSICMILRRW